MVRILAGSQGGRPQLTTPAASSAKDRSASRLPSAALSSLFAAGGYPPGSGNQAVGSGSKVLLELYASRLESQAGSKGGRRARSHERTWPTQTGRTAIVRRAGATGELRIWPPSTTVRETKRAVDEAQSRQKGSAGRDTRGRDQRRETVRAGRACRREGTRGGCIVHLS